MILMMIFLAAAAFAAIAWRDPAAACAITVALLPTYLVRFYIGPLPSTLLEVMLLELAVVWLLRRKRDPRVPPIPKHLQAPILLLMLGASIGILVSPDLRGALGIWRAYFIEPLLFFVVFLDVVRTPVQRRRVLIALAGTTIVVGAIAVYQKITGFGIPNPFWQAAATRRVTAFYGFPNAIGLFIAPILPLMAGWAWDLAPIKKKFDPLVLLPAATFLLGVLAIFFAISEGAIIGTAAGLLVFGLAWKPLRTAALGAIIAACLVVIFYHPATNYFSGIYGMTDDSTSVRAIVWRESLAMLADHPVFGAGLDGYRSVLRAYHDADWIEIFMYPHDVFLNFWSETGLIGLAGFVWLMVQAVRDAFRLMRRHAESALPAALLAAFVTLLVHGLVDVPFFKNDLAVLFWVLIAMAAGPRLYETGKN